MRLKYLLPFAVAALPFLASARPASPDPISITNPDGSVTQIRLYGDEHFSFVTDVDNNFILEKNSKGFYAPAIRNGQTLRFNENSVALLEAEVPQAPVQRPSGPARMAMLDPEGRTTFPTIGEKHFPVVLIEFSDVHFSTDNPAQDFYNLCNQENYSEYAGKGSVRDFYMASSNGLFKPTFDIYGPIRVSKTSEYYVAKDATNVWGAGKYGRYGEALSEAMLKLKADGVDFAKYDNDDDGDIDFVYFYYAGYGQADSGKEDTIWPHQSDFYNSVLLLGLAPIEFDSPTGMKRFGPYATSNELRGYVPSGGKQPYLDGIGAFCHEFGHVLGLPDLYDAPRQSGTSSVYTKTPGKWTVMDGGSYNINSTCPPVFSGYEQWVCRWLEYTELNPDTEGTHHKLIPLNDPNRNVCRLQVRKNSGNGYYNEYFVLENRGGHWDQGLPDSGMLVWRINYVKNTWANNRVNTGGVANVEIKEASLTSGMVTYPSADGFINAIYPGAEGQLKPVSSSNAWRCFVTGITRNDDESIDFDYNLITEIPDVTTVLHDDPTRGDNGQRTINIEWDPVPGADSYQLTVKRRTTTGSELFVNGYNEKNVGNTTSVLLEGISSTAFKNTFVAYVRVVSKVPSSAISNTITFVPQDLPVNGSAVAVIGADDFMAAGLKGAIDAPENAVIYNMNGIQTGRDNLPAGIYFVKVADRVQKVVVR